MPSPLIPFVANIATPDGSPYRQRMSQGFNEAMFFGSGLMQDATLATRIEGMMAACNGQAELADQGDAFIARMMALSWHLEYLVIALMGETISIDNHDTFLKSLGNLTGELGNIGDHPVLGSWVKQRLQSAQFRHFQAFGAVSSLADLPTAPVSRPMLSPWNSLPHEHAILLASEQPPLVG